MNVTTAQVFRRHHFARRGFHKRRPCKKDRALIFYDDGFVAHRGHIRAAGRARSHDDSNLRDARCAHRRLVVEDATEVIAIRKYLVLIRQICAARIDKIDARQIVLRRDFLRAQMLLHCQRVVSTALDRRIVSDDHALTTTHAPNAGNDACAGRFAVVHLVRRKA